MTTEVYVGAEGEVKVGPAASEVTVAHVTGISVEVSDEITGTRPLGYRTIKDWRLGNISVSGTIEKMWYDHDFLSKVRASGDSVTEFSIVTTLTGKDAVVKTATVTGVIFPNWSRELPEGDLVAETVEFEGRDITWS